MITTGEADLGDQILMDALGGEAKVEFGRDELGVGLAQPRATGLGVSNLGNVPDGGNRDLCASCFRARKGG